MRLENFQPIPWGIVWCFELDFRKKNSRATAHDLGGGDAEDAPDTANVSRGSGFVPSLLTAGGICGGFGQCVKGVWLRAFPPDR